MTDFVPILADTSAGTLELEVYEQLEAQFEGWQPAEGNLEVWLTKAYARIAASVFDMAALMSKEAFKKFGEAVVNVPPIQAAPATVASLWTMVDDSGYTIPAGTQIAIQAAGDTQVGFSTVGDVTVAPEESTAVVSLRAIEAGAAANDLGAAPTLKDALAFVQSITLEGVTAGGVDAEEEDAYLGRLVETLQLLSLSLILPRDFEIDARSYAGIARAKCVRNYNPEDKTSDNALMQCVFPIDAAGEPVSAPKKAELLAGQQAKLLTDVIHHVADPSYTEIDVESSFKVATGFDPAAVVAAVQARLTEYLSPANWGLPRFGDLSSIGGWVNQTSVYRLELMSEVDRVGGVDRVVTLKLAKHGNALGTSEELALTGVAPLTRPVTITAKAV